MSTPIIASKDKIPEINYEEWMESIVKDFKLLRKDVNSLVMDYFVKEGFKDAAEKFKLESGTEPNVDLSTLENKVEIRNLIENGQIEVAILLINKLHPELLDNERYLFFLLQQQQLIELIRQKQIEEALIFAQNNLAEYGEKDLEMLDQLEKTLALLAFDDPEKSPFGDLLSYTHRQKIASDITKAITKYENLPNLPPGDCNLSNVLKFLLWCQVDLNDKKIPFPTMTNLTTGEITLTPILEDKITNTTSDNKK